MKYITGEGMPIVDDPFRAKGNLIIKFKVQVPEVGLLLACEHTEQLKKTLPSLAAPSMPESVQTHRLKDILFAEPKLEGAEKKVGDMVSPSPRNIQITQRKDSAEEETSDDD